MLLRTSILLCALVSVTLSQIEPPSDCVSDEDLFFCKYYDQSYCSYDFFSANCQYRCGICQACNGLTCENKGWIELSSCTCGCHAKYTGDRCETENCPSTDPEYCGVGQNYPPSYCEEYMTVPYDCPIMCGMCP